MVPYQLVKDAWSLALFPFSPILPLDTHTLTCLHVLSSIHGNKHKMDTLLINKRTFFFTRSLSLSLCSLSFLSTFCYILFLSLSYLLTPFLHFSCALCLCLWLSLFSRVVTKAADCLHPHLLPFGSLWEFSQSKEKRISLFFFSDGVSWPKKKEKKTIFLFSLVKSSLSISFPQCFFSPRNSFFYFNFY